MSITVLKKKGHGVVLYRSKPRARHSSSFNLVVYDSLAYSTGIESIDKVELPYGTGQGAYIDIGGWQDIFELVKHGCRDSRSSEPNPKSKNDLQ